MKQTQLITFPFSSKLNDCIHNPIIMILGVARPLPPFQFDGISHAISQNKAQTHWVSTTRQTLHSHLNRQINERRAAGSLKALKLLFLTHWSSDVFYADRYLNFLRSLMSKPPPCSSIVIKEVNKLELRTVYDRQGSGYCLERERRGGRSSIRLSV